jgi:hypothetical protein
VKSSVNWRRAGYGYLYDRNVWIAAAAVNVKTAGANRKEAVNTILLALTLSQMRGLAPFLTNSDAGFEKLCWIF